tara:strand:+ start:897 stop:1364 length:468 start_codon:yes stop_codon:yes gene_type:complete
MSCKKDNKINISGPNGFELDRDYIIYILLNDDKINKLLVTVKRNEHLYWDDVDLVSDYYNDETIATITSDHKQTIGDLKNDIKKFIKNKNIEQEIKLGELQHSITILKEIKERLHSEIFYDSNWVYNESCNNQADFLIGVDVAIDKLESEREAIK